MNKTAASSSDVRCLVEAQGLAPFPSHRSPSSENEGSFLPEVLPLLEFLTPSWPSSRGWTYSPEVLLLFKDNTRASPLWSGVSIPASVPLSGFLNLSAVSWQTRISWPYFMPQPFLRFSLQGFSLPKVAHPSRGHLLPCCYSPAAPNEPPEALSALVSP